MNMRTVNIDFQETKVSDVYNSMTFMNYYETLQLDFNLSSTLKQRCLPTGLSITSKKKTHVKVNFEDVT